MCIVPEVHHQEVTQPRIFCRELDATYAYAVRAIEEGTATISLSQCIKRQQWLNRPQCASTNTNNKHSGSVITSSIADLDGGGHQGARELGDGLGVVELLHPVVHQGVEDDAADEQTGAHK